jgi:hypothetical protein
MAIYMFEGLYVVMNVFFVTQQPELTCQHTHKALSLTFFFSLLAQSKHVGWQLPCGHSHWRSGCRNIWGGKVT